MSEETMVECEVCERLYSTEKGINLILGRYICHECLDAERNTKTYQNGDIVVKKVFEKYHRSPKEYGTIVGTQDGMYVVDFGTRIERCGTRELLPEWLKTTFVVWYDASLVNHQSAEAYFQDEESAFALVDQLREKMDSYTIGHYSVREIPDCDLVESINFWTRNNKR